MFLVVQNIIYWFFPELVCQHRSSVLYLHFLLHYLMDEWCMLSIDKIKKIFNKPYIYSAFLTI